MLTAEVIAFLLPDTSDVVSGSNSPAQAATALLRDAQGKITIEPVTKDSAFVEQMLTTGCFQRGKAIVDPSTRQIMGYELEMIAYPLDSGSEARPKRQFAF